MLIKSICILLFLINGLAAMPGEKKKSSKGSTPRPPPPREVRIILPPPPEFLFKERPPPQELIIKERPPPQEPIIKERPPPEEPIVKERPPPREPFFKKGPPSQEPIFKDEVPPFEPPFGKRRAPPPLPYDDYGELRNYEFNYLIDDDYTRNYQTREESKDGERVVGSYTMQEPTGAIRVVKYVADEYGFRAMVRRLWPNREKS